ncbi:MAG: hypothetical protein LBR80_07350 [Deltaproteobacteria bacterium]|jgi:ABC-type nitrate/sulfonate/bicarbonate transport system substrate-binding protein|nr:hypothetical protein [Deltaproteobacteria bacterium]
MNGLLPANQRNPGTIRAARPADPASCRDGAPVRRRRRLAVCACLAVLGAACVSLAEDLRAEREIALGYSSIGGGVALSVAIANGYFAEEGIEVTPVKVVIEDFAEAVSSGRIVAGELDGQVLGLFRDGARLGPSAGLYSGFLEILASVRPPSGRTRLAVESLGGGPAVAAARHYRSAGIDPDSEVAWLEIPQEDLLDYLSHGKADAIARWELEKAKPAGGRGGGEGHGVADPHRTAGHGAAAEHGGTAGRGTAAEHGGTAGHGVAFGNVETTGQQVGTGHGGEGQSQESGDEGGDEPDDGEETPWKVLYSASASLPLPPDDGKASGNPHAGHTAASHFFTSFVVLGRDLYGKDPALAAAVTRAWIRGAARTGEDVAKAARLATEAGIWEGEAKGLEKELSRYMWMPGVAHAKEHLKVYIREWVKRGLLPQETDEAVFFGGLFIQALPDLN